MNRPAFCYQVCHECGFRLDTPSEGDCRFCEDCWELGWSGGIGEPLKNLTPGERDAVARLPGTNEPEI